MGANTGETLQERSKGKDVRTSNIVAAKVRSFVFVDRYSWGILRYLVWEVGRIARRWAFQILARKAPWSGGRTTVPFGWRLGPEISLPAATVLNVASH